MCFRPPTVEGATISCPKCGFEMPMDIAKCPRCGTPNAANAVAAPPIMPSVPGLSKPGAPKPGMPKIPGAPTAPKTPGAQTAPKAPGAASPSDAATAIDSRIPLALRDPGPDDGEIRIPVIGGVIRTPRGFAEMMAQNAPSVPTGPGFEEAPDISNTGNYFTTGNYNNG